MATAVSMRPAPVRLRRPAGSTVRPVGKSQGRTQRHTQPTERPDLRLVEPVRVKRFSMVTSALIGIATVLTLIGVFQTVIAEQQLRLDKVTTDVRLAHYHYDELRQQRAELRAPDYLREQAMMLGMSQGLSAKFEEVPADVVASVIAATGEMDKELLNPPVLEDLFSKTMKGATP